jgi:hypothetical protein
MSELLKLPKVVAFYAPLAPPPVAFQYECQFCPFWIPPENGTPPLCQIVSEKGPPDEDMIKAEAWCILWIPNGKNAPLSWLSGQQVDTAGNVVDTKEVSLKPL